VSAANENARAVTAAPGAGQGHFEGNWAHSTSFRDAIEAAGITPPETICADGKLHRFPSNGARGDDAGWYVFYGDAVPAGAFGDWRTGVSQAWRADIGRKLTAAEQAIHRARLKAMSEAREAEEAKRRAEATNKAAKVWSEAKPAPADHPYLTRKAINPHGVRVHDGRLVIPLRADGKLHSLQFIDADGEKRFLPGGAVKGCYFAIGDPAAAAALVIAEGFATGAAIHEATGYPVAVAFNAGNLEAVARAMRQRFPNLPLILAADDDYKTNGNPGLTKANEAARAVGGLVALPDFGAERPERATDFNDLAAHRGLDAVQQCFALTLSNSNVTDVTDVQPGNGAACSVTAEDSDDVTAVTEPGCVAVSEHERPCFRVFDDWADEKLRPGVWYFGLKAGKGDDPSTLSQQWVCSPLHVEAVTMDGQENNFGRLLRFRNTAGKWREWAMPMELLAAAGDELRRELLAMGVMIDPSGHRLLSQYLQAVTPARRVSCALQVGWCGNSFVLPDAVIGPAAASVIFQSGERGHDEYTRAGTLAEWQAEIAARAVGNSLLTLALSAAFAGPLLERCNAEGGGAHFVGDSSTGKTTLLEAACSVWGGPNYRRSWRSTANGMEGAAALFNDCLLALDEISECDPREVGAIVYALGNGRGKQRASRSGGARSVTRWRCFVLSSGERTIDTTMTEGGHRVKAGQAVRLLDIPTARRFGAWDELHGLPSGTAFSDALKRAAATHYGHAGRAFLERLTRDGRDFCELLERFKSLTEFSCSGAEGQHKRAAARFALLALAGELATEYGITPWAEGAAVSAAVEGFKSWASLRGRGNDERRQTLERVAAFIERHGDGRFSNADSAADVQIRDRAGWWRDSAQGREYLFTSEGLREALKGFDFKRALDVLQESGAIPKPGASGERAVPQRIAGRPVRVYPVQAEKLGGEYGD